jgi:topoisomerase IA-like protein
MFVSKRKYNDIENELDELLVEVEIMSMLLAQAQRELVEFNKSKAKQRHPSTSKKTVAKKTTAKKAVKK